MKKGSCLCGTVRFEIDGPIGETGHCHCRMCQKAHGAAFGTYTVVDAETFRWTAGESHVRRYDSSSEVTRTFCDTCGSNLQFIKRGRRRFGLAIAALDDDPEVHATYEIWTSSRAPWVEADGELLSHETEPGSG